MLSSPPPAPAPTSSAIDELNSLKDSLEKLESAASKSSSSSGGSSDNSDVSLIFITVLSVVFKPGNAEEIEARRKRMERNTRIGAYVLFGGSIIGFISFCFYYGRAQRDEFGNVISDEFSGSFLAPFYRIANSFKLWRDVRIQSFKDSKKKCITLLNTKCQNTFFLQLLLIFSESI